MLAVGFGKEDKLDLPRFDRACLAAGKALREALTGLSTDAISYNFV